MNISIPFPLRELHRHVLLFYYLSLFLQYLFAGNKFGQIVGEEDDSEVNILKEPFYVDELEVPAEFTPLIKGTH